MAEQTSPRAGRVERPRPVDMSEEQLGFRPRRAVRWLAPGVLIPTGAKVLLAGIFGSYADKREMQGGLPDTVFHHDEHEELWLDFVADLGDGFDATYSVASLLGADELTVDGVPLPRGLLLVMGGDQVYPVASTRDYEDRSKGVYRCALPRPPEPAPTLLALPGNHDWYDGLTAFLRVFAQGGRFGGWKTEQTRSYFAVRLPHRWWLLAIDTQFDAYIDAPQLAYFRAVSEQLREGDSVILCTSAPDWVPAGSVGESSGYDAIEFFQREITRPRGARIRLMLSGDKHHYARYAERDGSSQRITCGLGGAYLSATHLLPDSLSLPPPRSRVRNASPPARYDLAARYPEKRRSAALSAGIFRLPWRNPGFWALTGVTQTVMTLAVLVGLAGTDRPASVFGLVAAWSPAAIAGTLLVLAAVTFAGIDPPRAGPGVTVAGLLHAGAHLGLSVAWAFVVRWLYGDVFPGGVTAEWLVFAVMTAGTPLVIGFIDAELVAAYLLVASRFGININEAFAGQSIEDHKGFLRLHLGADGSLTVYPIKVDRVCRAWRVDPDGEPGDPWLRPDGRPPRPELIEPPFRIPRS